MAEVTARLRLPLIAPGQAQKEVYHNEALARIDVAMHPVVENASSSVPPTAPVEGQSWIVAAGATGDWIGRSGQIASWTSGGWRFVEPVAGMLTWHRSAGHWLHWSGTAWSTGALPATKLVVGGVQVVGARQPTIAGPTGGTSIDQEARAAIAALIATLKSHGLIE